ncbi:hydrogenase maturation nickel metallochaperone HypA/HybF [Asanoa siamensis]|uniref:Hydrogenase maturation factor HypA n=1 Tax=Asanoa siamensis TaxID=926357 RepID=A0ABQ4D2M1_9ACTN|nr:hydrogenase maturation nickel metallochaperone HypA [Asanoa siamensis]GIF77786.1 hydrogenase nickel incorporation protein HypA [Asanoa siamensis]
MHELAITQSVVDEVLSRAGSRPVHAVHLRVGALTAVVPSAVEFCFDLVAAGTVVEGAKLHIDLTPGRAACRSCGVSFDLPDPVLLCACGSADVSVLAGRELKIVSMEVG